MRLVDGVPVWGEPDQGAIDQIKMVRATAPEPVAVALMADSHLGYSMPIGGVAAYQGAVSPSGVGYDIGCGNQAVLTDMPGAEARANIHRIMDDVTRSISFGIGRVNDERIDHDLFDDPAWSIPAVKALRDRAAKQLGTAGSGNHYCNVFVDDDDRTWVGVHFGSRGLGHGIATHYLKKGGAVDGMNAPPLVLAEDSALGTEYIAAMHLAVRYAYAGREWVCARLLEILGARELDRIHNNHNEAVEEVHDGERLWVVRKGATPAWPDQRGFVGGSMGDISVILEGVGAAGGASLTDEQRLALASTVHGAGRAMSRSRAKGRVQRRWVADPDAVEEVNRLRRSISGMPRGGDARRETGARIEQLRRRGHWEENVIRPGEISREAMIEWLDRQPWGRVDLRGADTDEAPQAYKRIESVLAAHEGTVRVLHRLYPIGVAMAGPNIVDPYKD